MDYESSDSRAKGCWDPAPLLTPFLDKWSAPTPPGREFVVDEVWCGMVGSLGFGDHGSPESLAFWTRTLREVYRGEEGRGKARMALVNLLSRDGLLLRLRDVKCPVRWLQVCGLASTPPPPPGDRRSDVAWVLMVLSGQGYQGRPVWNEGARRADQAVHCRAEGGADVRP